MNQPPPYPPPAHPGMPYQPPPPPPQPKKRHLGLKIVGGLVALFVALSIIGSVVGGDDAKKASDPQPTATGSKAAVAPKGTTPKPTPKASASTSVGRGFGSKDASGDVKLGKPTTNGYWVVIPVTVTNHSSKRSDYFIDVSLESADGKTQYDTGSAFARRVEPGQSAREEVLMTKVKELPSGARPSLKSVQRSPSI